MPRPCVSFFFLLSFWMCGCVVRYNTLSPYRRKERSKPDFPRACGHKGKKKKKYTHARPGVSAFFIGIPTLRLIVQSIVHSLFMIFILFSTPFPSFSAHFLPFPLFLVHLDLHREIVYLKSTNVWTKEGN